MTMINLIRQTKFIYFHIFIFLIFNVLFFVSNLPIYFIFIIGYFIPFLIVRYLLKKEEKYIIKKERKEYEDRRIFNKDSRTFASKEDYERTIIALQSDKISMEKFIGVNGDYTFKDLKKAYKNKMKICHPDVSGNHDDAVKFNNYFNTLKQYLERK